MSEIVEDETERNETQDQVEIPGYGTFSNYIAEGYNVIMKGVKASGGLPTGRNYQFYQTYSNFREKMREKYSDIQDVMEDLLRSQEVKAGVRDVMMEDAMDTMISMNDKMLDRATRYMDLMEGIKTGLGELVQEVSGSWNRSKKSDATKTFSLSIKKNIPRPQFTFRDKPDNGNTIWEPKIKEKPNALKPLAILVESNDDGDECFSHPYEYELELFNVPENQLKRVKKIQKAKPIEETPFEIVETEEQLNNLVNHLDTQTAFAVDLENHSYRSFLGFTCLIQISTREKDFIIDALSLRHALHCLNVVFTKPTILKVFHGADQDIVWLQRDFSVYVVNMFDTHQAAKQLNYPKLSLAFLLNLYCKVDANKHFQLFDWRTRPLPDEAIRYAREDTHYLLYIADIMAQQLIDKANGNVNILKAVYQQSKQVCVKRFEKLVVDEESHMRVYRKGKRYFDNRQLFALKALYLWRDKTARELDESLSYVFPDSMMLNVAENLPREVQGILACCNPVPPLVKVSLLELHYLIVRAKEQPLVKIIPEGTKAQVLTQKSSGVSEEQIMLEQWYHPASEMRDDLPTLLNTEEDLTEYDFECKPALSLFSKEEEWYNTSEANQMVLEADVLEKLKGLNFVSPYQRYIRVLPYSAQLEKERNELEIKQAEEHRQRSREQQMLAMEIKSLQESGLIKLKKEENEKSRVESLKLQLSAERKRKGEGGENQVPSKLRRRQNRNRMKAKDDGDRNGEEEPTTLLDDTPSTSELQVSELDRISTCSTVKTEDLKDEVVETPEQILISDRTERPYDKNQRPTSWKELRQQNSRSIKPFDFSQVDYNQKFGGGRNRKKEQNKSNSSVFDKKKKWKNNPGAQKFAKKKRKRNPVV